MTWARMSNSLQAVDGNLPTFKVSKLSSFLEEGFDKPLFLKIISMDYGANNMALLKAKKWMAEIFEVHEEEIEGQYLAHGDLGEAIYYLDFTEQSESTLGLNSILTLLETDCGRINSNSFSLIKEAILSMSSNERKWFIRYWLKTPRNGINKGTAVKIMAKHFGKKQSVVKNHLTLNSIESLCCYYINDETPPMKLSHGTFVAPMLAKSIPMENWPERKIVDYKYDGNRYQIHRKGVQNVIIFNRKGEIVTEQFRDVALLVSKYPYDCVLDGEIYPINEDGTPAEHKLMATRVHSKDRRAAMEKVPVKWVAFDCLKVGNDTLIHQAYWQRLLSMDWVPDQAHRMEEGEDIMAFYHRAINDGFEGIIVKDATLPYQAGKRSVGWAKYKPPQIELDVAILSASYGEGKRSNVFGTFEIGVKGEGEEYVGVGSVETGFSDADLLRLTNLLRRHIVSHKNGKYFFLPRIVLEVKADLVSKDSKGNLGLRFPRCNRIREDKFVYDCNTLADLDRLV